MKFMISDQMLPTLHTFSLIRPTLFDFNPLVRIGHTPATFSAVALLHSSTQSSIFFTVTKAPALLHVLLLQRTTPVSRPFVRFRSCFSPYRSRVLCPRLQRGISCESFPAECCAFLWAKYKGLKCLTEQSLLSLSRQASKRKKKKTRQTAVLLCVDERLSGYAQMQNFGNAQHHRFGYFACVDIWLMTTFMSWRPDVVCEVSRVSSAVCLEQPAVVTRLPVAVSDHRLVDL